MYKQNLYKILPDYIKPKILSRMNRYKKWEYGYNIDHDMVVISKTGQIGEIYEIQNLKIALPKQNNVHKFEENKWTRFEYPKVLSKIKTVFDWREYPEDFKEKWYDYIDEEFARREEGFWYFNKSIPTYITVTHYMYLQWSKIDVGQPDFREANRIFSYSGPHVLQTPGVTVCPISRTDVLAFRLWHPESALTWRPYQPTHVLGFCPNLAPMLRRCLPTRLYKYPLIIHSFSSPSRTEWTVQRPSLPTESPRPSSQEGVSSKPLVKPVKPSRVWTLDRLEEHRG